MPNFTKGHFIKDKLFEIPLSFPLYMKDYNRCKSMAESLFHKYLPQENL